MELRAEFGFSAVIDIDFSFESEIMFDGDLAAWADLGAATAAVFDYDFTGKTAYALELELDIDNDGVAETVKFLLFSDGSGSDYEHGFASWRGDRYSFDRGYCYVLSWEGDDALLMSGPCGSTGPALACPMQSGEADSSNCQVCDASGECAACSESTVSACIEEGSAELDPPDVVVGEGGAAGAAGAPGTATTGSVDAEFDSCVEEVRELQRAADDCDLDVDLDSAALCEERLSDVNLCFLAVEGARLFSSTCDAVESSVCDPVYR
jgi:hypothetical protein